MLARVFMLFDSREDQCLSFSAIMDSWLAPFAMTRPVLQVLPLLCELDDAWLRANRCASFYTYMFAQFCYNIENTKKKSHHFDSQQGERT